MTVMQEQLSSLVQSFSRPPSQSDRRKDDSLPVKRSASKREWSSFPREPLRASSKARHRASSSSAHLQDSRDARRQDNSVSRSRRQDDSVSRSRRQDDSVSRSRRQDDSVSRSRRQDDSSLLLQDDAAPRRQDDCSSRHKNTSFSRHQDASAYRLKDSSSARRQDAPDSRRRDDTSARRQDASDSRCQAACSPLLQDAFYDFPLSDSGEPSIRPKAVVEVGQDLDDVSEDEDKPADVAGDYKVLSRSLLELYGEEFHPSAPRSLQSLFSRKKAKKHSAFIKMKLSISAKKALAKVDE
ncbi:serine/arginine-rich splicing factor 4-like [Palaemon carinicauda]|uniref:serine/arginine-rich splicing factor 4-like n=1 Tax=Palaemon carinicauda TaxID=392227 RepID=UPI0035B6910E